jgi:hypothetical protein
MGQSPQSVLKKRNRPNARQRRHRWAARSPIDDMTFCAPHRAFARDLSPCYKKKSHN